MNGRNTQTATKRNVWSKIGVETAVYACVFLLTVIAFLVLKPQIETHRQGFVAQVIMSLGICACIAFIAYLGTTKRLTMRKIIIALMIVGLIMRIGYMLYTPASSRQHDTFSKNFDGHEAYAWTIFSTGKLPTTNKYQFYHPPLNAFFQGAFMRIMHAFTELFSAGESFYADFAYRKPDYVNAERYFLFSSTQILAVLYSVVTMVVSLKILSLFDFSDKIKLLVAAIVVLYPRNIHFAGMLNNDALAYMLSTLALYYGLKWWKVKKDILWIFLCGLSVGLGMMTKLASATICLPLALVFIYEFIQTLRKKQGALPFAKMCLQYGGFLCICAGIGLWFQVYAKIRFDQNFGYVWNNLTDRLYTGDKSWFERFIFPFDSGEFFDRIYCYSFDNYYLFNFALRSSIFGEQSYSQADVVASLSVCLAYLAAAALAVAIVWALVLCVRTKRNKTLPLNGEGVSWKDFLFTFTLLQSQVLSEIYFYITMPYGCTMDFRYIMPMILAMALTVGCVQKTLIVRGGKASLALRRILTGTIVAFLAASTLFYLTCV